MRLWLASLLGLLGGACDSEPEPRALGALEEDAEARPRYAAVSSDFSAAAISLLNAAGDIVADDYIDSGSAKTGLVTALSGDIDLPGRSGDDGVLVIIDRFKNDVITRVDLSTGNVLGQVKTHTPSDQHSETSFTSNPQDYIRVDAQSAWVTRSQPNLNPGAPEIDRGNDLLRIDPSAFERSEERIDLSSLDTVETRMDPTSGDEQQVQIYARPNRMTRVGNTLVVGLARASFDFSVTASGMVALIDLDEKTVSGFELEGLRACTHVSAVPGTTDRVLVGCMGAFPDTRQTAGVAIVRVTAGAASVTRSWKASEHDDAPTLAGSFIALAPDQVGAAENAFDPSAGDSTFGVIDLVSGEFTSLLSIPAGSGTFGNPTYDEPRGLLLVPDASVDGDLRPTAGVRRLERRNGTFAATSVIEVAADTGMPVRFIYAL